MFYKMVPPPQDSTLLEEFYIDASMGEVEGFCNEEDLINCFSGDAKKRTYVIYVKECDFDILKKKLLDEFSPGNFCVKFVKQPLGVYVYGGSYVRTC